MARIFAGGMGKFKAGVSGVRRGSTLAILVLGAGVALGGVDAQAAASVPADLKAAIGKTIWYAPHTGCLDRLKVRDAAGAKERWVRRFPETEQKLRITEAVMADGQWMYRFEWSGDGASGNGLGTGQTPAQKVVTDVRFEALPTTFYQTCFFLEPPQAVAGFLKAQQPLALQRYDKMSRADRDAEIARIDAADKKAAR